MEDNLKYERFLNARALFADWRKCAEVLAVIEKCVTEKTEGTLKLCIPLELLKENTLYFVLTANKKLEAEELAELKKFLEETIQCDVIVYVDEAGSDSEKYYSYSAPVRATEVSAVWGLIFRHFAPFFSAVPREPSRPEKPRRYDGIVMVIKDPETIEIQAEKEESADNMMWDVCPRQRFVDPECYESLGEEIINNVLGVGYQARRNGAVITVAGNLSNFIHTLHLTEKMGATRFLKLLKRLRCG